MFSQVLPRGGCFRDVCLAGVADAGVQSPTQGRPNSTLSLGEEDGHEPEEKESNFSTWTKGSYTN